METLLDVQGEYGAIGVKTVADDGTIFRRVIEPGADVSQESAEIQALAAQTWTPAIVAAWEARLQAGIPPLPPQRPMVIKSIVQARIIAAGKMPQAYQMLTGNAVYFARWFAPDHAAVYCDDPDAVSLVQALGLDPAVILAP